MLQRYTFSTSLLTSLACLLFSACSGLSTRNEQVWSERYNQANKFLTEKTGDWGCAIFSELVSDTEHPLFPLIRIKQAEACRTEALAQQLWKNKGSDIPRWAKEYYTKQSLELALNLDLKADAAYFSAELSDYQAPKAVRIALMRQAFDWAEGPKKEEYTSRLLKLSPQQILEYPPLLTDEQKKLKRRKKDYIPTSLLLELALDLEKDRKFSMARKYYQQVQQKFEFPDDQKFQAWKRYCFTYKLERDREKYVQCFKDGLKTISKFNLTPSDEVELRIQYARALWTIDRVDESLTQLQELLKNDSIGQSQRSKLHLAVAGIFQEQKKFTAAIDQLQFANLVLAEGNAKEKEEIFWRTGFSHYLQQNYQEALNFWSLLAKQSESYALRLQSQFWSAKCLQKLGNRDDATELFEDLAQQDEFGYYGILSYRELGKKFKSMSSLSKPNIRPDDLPPVLHWLLEIEQDEMARRYLRFHSYGIKSEEEVSKAIPIYHYARAYDLAILSFYKIPAEKRNESLLSLAPYVFPLPYASEVFSTSSRFMIPPEYVFSIIRQESAFNTFARSFADAFGLMQVIPEKAELLKKELEIPYQNLEDLYRPEVNLPIGGAILADNINRYKRSFVASTAAYNAGDTPVVRWYQDRYRGDLLEFIENIPYEETQNYVKLVMRNMINYYRFTTDDDFEFRDSFFNEL